MTVSSSLNRKAYAGDGVTTSFSTSPVVFFNSSDLDVYVVTTATGASTTLTENTHYTVSGGAGLTGAVSLAGGSSPYGAPSAAQTLVIVRTLDLVQNFDPQNNDGSDAGNIETAFDKLTMMAQQNAAAIARAFKLADSDVSGASTTLPTPSASKLIGWDSAGTALANYASATIVDSIVPTAFMETLLDDTSAATARTTLDAMQDVFTTRGDMVRAGASGVAERVALGASGTVLKSDGTDAVWGSFGAGINGFRLSLTTAVPVTTADVTAAGTLYCVPYIGKEIDLYTGSAWVRRSSAEFSLALTLTSGKPYDVFCYDNAGTPTLEVLVWTNDTTRATALAYKDGILVKSGDATRRYLGSLYASGANTTEDSAAKRYLWNYYNRVDRPMRAVDTTDSWNYTTATFRQANANAANQLDFVVGVSEDAVFADVLASAFNSTAGIAQRAGIGVDSTSVNSATRTAISENPAINTRWCPTASYEGFPGIGRHTLVWLEYSTASGTTTWNGDNGGGAVGQSGIAGRVKA